MSNSKKYSSYFRIKKLLAVEIQLQDKSRAKDQFYALQM